MIIRSSWLSNLKFRTQVMVYQVVICTIIMVLFMIISFKHLNLIESIFEDSSKFMLLNKYSKGINLIQNLNSQTISRVIRRNKQLLYNMQHLYYFSLFYNPNIQQPIDCLTNVSQQNIYAFNFTQCYGFFSQENVDIEINDKQLMNFTALITESILMLDRGIDQILSVVTLRNSTYYALIPGTPLKNYNPHMRSWYLNQISFPFSHETQFSQPYRLISNDQYSLTQTMYFQNNNLYWEGILSSEVKFEQFQDLVDKQLTVNLQLVGNNSIIYLDQNPKNINTPIQSYIQNKYEGNIEILQFIDKVINSQSTNQNSQAQLIFIDDNYFIINNIKTTKIFLLQSINIKDRISNSQEMIALQIKSMNYQIQVWIIIQLFIGISLIIASIIVIVLITQPINNTIHFINSKINPLKMYIISMFRKTTRIYNGLEIFKQTYITFNKKLTDSCKLKHLLLQDHFHLSGQQSLTYWEFIIQIRQIANYPAVNNTKNIEQRKEISKVIKMSLKIFT